MTPPWDPGIRSRLTRCLQNGVYSRSGPIRMLAGLLLRAPRNLQRYQLSRTQSYPTRTVLGNSFPKSGTHLLQQVIDALPMQINYGVFLASMTGSFAFRERTTQNTLHAIRAFVPGEIVRAHLFYDPTVATALRDAHVIHYFIYRDPRDVAVSEAHYLRCMNPWHRLHRYFKHLSEEEAIELAIRGMDDSRPELNYPNIAARFRRYADWLNDPNTLSIRFEDLRGDRQEAIVRTIVQFHQKHCQQDYDLNDAIGRCLAAIEPTKSHTFRSGQRGGWRKAMSPANIGAFQEACGDLLIELRYEQNNAWS